MIKEEILENLEKIYIKKPHRLSHVIGVRDTALELGKRYNCDLEKLEIAALLHDITKYLNYEEHIKIISNYFPNSKAIISEYNEHILHAFSAYVVAKQKYGIEDEDILNAIMSHTIGKPAMTIYEEIIFISDYIEPNRTYESCKKVRTIAADSLHLAVFTAIDDSITHYEKHDGQIPKTAYEARTYYKNLLEEQK